MLVLVQQGFGGVGQNGCQVNTLLCEVVGSHGDAGHWCGSFGVCLHW